MASASESYCNHALCVGNTAKGVAVCIWDDRRCQVLMGKERFGRYRGRWNVCAGSVEACDKGCLIAAARRELKEEFKLDMNESTWHNCLRRSFWIASTLVAILRPPRELNVVHLDQENQKMLLDSTAPPTYQEMEKIQWVQLDNDDMPISSLAKYIMKKYHNTTFHLRTKFHKRQRDTRWGQFDANRTKSQEKTGFSLSEFTSQESRVPPKANPSVAMARKPDSLCLFP